MENEEKNTLRDKRKTTWFWIDKRIIEFKGFNSSDKVVYMILAYFANNNTQKCWPSTNKIAELANLTQRTVIKSLSVLEENKVLKVERKSGRSSNYIMLKTDHIKNFSGENKEGGVVKISRTNNNNINNISLSKDKDNVQTFNFQHSLKEMKEGKRRDLQIIANYWEFKGMVFNNREQYQEALKREFKPAGKLKGYSDGQILETMEWLSYDPSFCWKLETVHKFIDEDLENLKPFVKK